MYMDWTPHICPDPHFEKERHMTKAEAEQIKKEVYEWLDSPEGRGNMLVVYTRAAQSVASTVLQIVNKHVMEEKPATRKTTKKA